MIRVDVMQAWQGTAAGVLSKIGAIQDSGYTSGSTEYSFIVETKKSPDKVRELLFGTGMHWAKVRKHDPSW